MWRCCEGFNVNDEVGWLQVLAKMLDVINGEGSALGAMQTNESDDDDNNSTKADDSFATLEHVPALANNIRVKVSPIHRPMEKAKQGLNILSLIAYSLICNDSLIVRLCFSLRKSLEMSFWVAQIMTTIRCMKTAQSIDRRSPSIDNPTVLYQEIVYKAILILYMIWRPWKSPILTPVSHPSHTSKSVVNFDVCRPSSPLNQATGYFTYICTDNNR